MREFLEEVAKATVKAMIVIIVTGAVVGAGFGALVTWALSRWSYK